MHRGGGFCKVLSKELAQNNVEYVDYDVEKPTRKDWLLNALGIDGYPTVYIGYQRIHAANYAKVMDALKNSKEASYAEFASEKCSRMWRGNRTASAPYEFAPDAICTRHPTELCISYMGLMPH